MTISTMQFAHRERVGSLITPRRIAIVLGLTTVLAIVGPYETHELLTPLQRFVFWLLVICLSWLVGRATPLLIRRMLPDLSLPFHVTLVALGTATAMLLLVLIINAICFGVRPGEPGYMRMMMFTVFGVTFILSFLLYWHEQTHLPAATADSAPPVDTVPAEPPRLLERLDEALRGELISISVADHYVNVTTTKGTGAILMRLSDAMLETGDVCGLQIHRSHWVALGHVTKVQRERARAVLTVSDGRELPASRTYLPALREAGLLPAHHG
ncbi:LytTR family DNA-binding domain-containing protein [Pseudoroseicyclus sp. H15]